MDEWMEVGCVIEMPSLIFLLLFRPFTYKREQNLKSSVLKYTGITLLVINMYSSCF